MINEIDLNEIFYCESFDTEATVEDGFYRVVYSLDVELRTYCFEQHFYFDFITNNDHAEFLRQVAKSSTKEAEAYFGKVSILNQ